MRAARVSMRLARVRGMATMPAIKPACPNFSSGPCAKRPGYDLNNLATAPLGRSHRAKVGKSKLAAAITKTKELLMENGMPEDYHVGIVPGALRSPPLSGSAWLAPPLAAAPRTSRRRSTNASRSLLHARPSHARAASDTGAVEMAMWSLLGPRPVTIVHFESFGSDWFTDATKQLKLENVTNVKADYGVLPDLNAVDWDTDVRCAPRLARRVRAAPPHPTLSLVPRPPLAARHADSGVFARAPQVVFTFNGTTA
eukprot:23773-Prymnesium_polylepis.1